MSDSRKPASARKRQPRPAKSGRDAARVLQRDRRQRAGHRRAWARWWSPISIFRPTCCLSRPPRFAPAIPICTRSNSVTFLQEQQVYIVRTAQGFYAVSAVCTHLGCITQWKPDDKQIACPCHGSKFQSRWHKVEGPRPHRCRISRFR